MPYAASYKEKFPIFLCEIFLDTKSPPETTLFHILNSTHAREVFAIKYFEINFWICTIYYIYKYQDCGFTKIKRDCPMHSRRKLLSLEEIFWANMKHCAIAGNVDQITLHNQSPFLHQDWKSKYFLENAQIELKHICGLFIIFRKVKDLIIKVGEKFLLIHITKFLQFTENLSNGFAIYKHL